MTYITPRQLLIQIDRNISDKEVGNIKRRLFLKGARSYLRNKHIYRLAIESELRSKVVIENGVKKYIKKECYLGGEVIMTGRDAKERNAELSRKFWEKSKTNPNAKLFVWHLIKKNVE